MKTILISLVLLGLVEAIVKPLVTRLTQAGIKKYIFPAYQRLDNLLTIPANWKSFVSNAENFVVETVIPDELDEQMAQKLTGYLLRNFDLDTFLVKAKGTLK